jgi:hypothetical protein
MSALRRVADEIRARGKITGDDALALTLLDALDERERYREAAAIWEAEAARWQSAFLECAEARQRLIDAAPEGEGLAAAPDDTRG